MAEIDWHIVKDVLYTALNRPVVDRPSYLDSACGNNEALRSEVEYLLESYESGFLERPALAGLSAKDRPGPPLLEIGSSLSHYRIIQLLGRGGMGEVYLATDLSLDRLAAIKVIHGESGFGDQSAARLLREARSAAKLDHPNICQVYEVGEAEGHPFIAMQFVEGEMLDRLIAAGPIAFDDAVSYARQTAAALAKAHAYGIVHRDIKPSNIIVDPQKQIKVLDFGLAKETDINSAGPELTTQGLIAGTVTYMSPEHARGQEIDGRTDVWSLGVVLYQMLTGRLPFRGGSRADLISAILNDEPAEAEELPVALRYIIGRALEKDTAIRYADIAEFEADLAETASTGTLASSAASLEGRAKAPVTVVASSLGRKAPRTYRSYLAIALLIVVISVSGFWWFGSFSPANPKQIKSIAVMPFVNASGNSNIDYLSDGMTDTLIVSLSQLPELSVKARSTVFHYKGKDTPSKVIGSELNVQAVLLGRVVQLGDNFKLNLELVDTNTQDVIWTEQYERKQSDLVSLQADIARDVSGKLRIKLSGADQIMIAKRPTENSEAYSNFLLGRFYWNKRTGNDLKKSVEYYQSAIDLDPKFALAYAGLANSYVLFPSLAGAQPDEAFPKAEAAAKKALELDETLAEAHTALSYVLFNYSWKFDESEKEIHRAIELNPNYSTAYHWYGNANLLALGRFDESIAAMKKASELDPLSLIINADLATSYCYSLHLDEAIGQYNKTLEMDNSFYYAHVYLGRAYLLKGEPEKALFELQQASGLESDPRIPMLRSRIYSKMGRRADALEALNELTEMRKRRYVSNFDFALVFTGLGDKDQAFASLEKAFAAHDGNLVYLKADPLLADLCGDPRYVDLLRRMGLPG